MKDVFLSTGPKAGDVLVASPEMSENLFSRTLVFLQNFSGEGALGFILNRPLGQAFQQAATTTQLPEAVQDIPVFFGGPVQSHQLVLMHFIPRENHGFSCGAPEEDLTGTAELNIGDRIHRAFMGYAGWTAGQLEEEIRRGDWNWVPADTVYLQETFGDAPWELASSADRRWQTFRERLPRSPEFN